MILRKKIESIFVGRIAEVYPAQSVMKGHDVGERDIQSGVTLYCSSVREYDDGFIRRGVYSASLMLIIESNTQDEDNTQASIETLAGQLTDIIEDTTALGSLINLRAYCTTNYPEIYLHDIKPSEDMPEVEDYNLNNLFNYEIVFEYLDV